LQYFHSASVLDNSNSEAHQTKLFRVIINGNRHTSSLQHGTAEMLYWKKQFQTKFIRLSILRKVAIVC